MMDPAYLSAFSALAGSAIGAMASFGTTWLTQHHQDRVQRLSQESTRREKLYGEFIDEASKVFADALTHDLDDLSKLVPLYAIKGKLQLFASNKTIAAAEAVMQRIVQTYHRPNEDLKRQTAAEHEEFAVLEQFTKACRDDLFG